MNRMGKGSAIEKHVDNYCIVDLETTDLFISVTRIIEISAIRVRNNKVVGEFSTLINPLCHIPKDSTAINHITDDMVKGAPELDSVIDSFIDYLGDDVIIGYNIATFDMNIIYDALMKLRSKTFENDYIDVLHVARRCISDIENYKLGTLCKYFGIDTEGEHRAQKDCYLTKECYDRLYESYGEQAFIKKRSKWPGEHRPVHHTPETIALQKLQQLLQAIIHDGRITLDELEILSLWLENNRDLQGNYPFDRVFNALDRVLEDGRITQEELNELQILFTDYVDPVKSHGYHDIISSIVDKHIVVTGDFDYGNRNDVCALIESAGGILDKSVKKATDYVVVGTQGSENWKTGNYGGKIQKAMEMNDKGYDIRIVEESVFIPAVINIIEDRSLKG